MKTFDRAEEGPSKHGEHGRQKIGDAQKGNSGRSEFPHIVILHEALPLKEHVVLGSAYETPGLPNMAAEQYQKVLQGDHHFVPALLAMGNLAFHQHRLQEAEEWFVQVLGIDPLNPSAANNLAMVYMEQERNLKEAEGLAETALERSGALSPYVLDTLARIYLKQARLLAARNALRRAEESIGQTRWPLRARLEQLRKELDGARFPTRLEQD